MPKTLRSPPDAATLPKSAIEGNPSKRKCSSDESTSESEGDFNPYTKRYQRRHLKHLRTSEQPCPTPTMDQTPNWFVDFQSNLPLLIKTAIDPAVKSAIDTAMQPFSKRLDKIEERVNLSELKNTELEAEMNTLKDDFTTFKSKMERLSVSQAMLDDKSRETNLLFMGFAGDEKNETETYQVVRRFITNDLGSSIHPYKAFRFGQTIPRPIRVVFKNIADRDTALGLARANQNPAITIKPDRCPLTRERLRAKWEAKELLNTRIEHPNHPPA